MLNEIEKKVTRDLLDNLKDAMLLEEQVEIHVVHHFTRGIYCREMQLPKGVIAVGKIHKYDHINILSKGDVTIATENGVFRIQAPYTMQAKAGQNCAAYAHEDTVWTTIHPTDLTDVDEIEKEFISPSREEYLEWASLKLEGK